MIAFRIPISPAQVATYQGLNPGEIDTASNELILRCDINDVTIINTRTGTVINKLSGTPIAGKRDIKYDFVAAEWEFTAYISIQILSLISELENTYPLGIPVKNYLEGTGITNPFVMMDIKILSAERRGATVDCSGSYRPLNGVLLRIARVDLPN